MAETIRILPLSGVWQTLGVDRLRGIVPEAIEPSSNDWGPDTMNFRLAAEAGARRPDILPFSPVELEVDGIVVWAGFTFTRPTDENGYSITCRGWQYHLDDDLYDRVYVHTKLTDWTDGRGFLDTDLTNRTAAWTVSNQDGQIVLALPSGSTAATGKSCSVVLDLGPDSTAKLIKITAKGGAAPANLQLILRGATSSPTGADETTTAATTLPTTDTTYPLTFTTPRRYVEILLSNQTGATLTGTEATWVRVNIALVVRATAYESGGASVLAADTVIKDALTFAPMLNPSTGLIATGTFAIPEYLTDGYKSPRQVMEAVNAYENNRLKVGGSDLKTLVYDVKPAAPLFEIGDWSGAQFTDASVTGEDIYDRVVTDATGPDGARLVSTRTQTGTLVDRRGYHRARTLPISTAVTTAVANRFGDLWLTEHKTAPFAGTLTVSSNDAVRRVLGGASVSASELLLFAGEKIRLSNRNDPDTGAQGRDGRIAAVSYNATTGVATVSIDDQRDRLDKLLARYGVLADQLR